MKPSEIAARLAPLYAARLNGPPYTLAGVPLEAIARALDVPVEPDEPDPVRLRVVAGHYDLGDGRISREIRGESATGLGSPFCEITARSRRDINLLVDAFNERPAWRTGSPPDGDRWEYAVKRTSGLVCAAWWSGTVAGWSRHGESINGTVTGWQPLPAP